MTKALLMLTGGRGIPDMLVIKYLRPDIIFNLTTKQGLRTAQHLAQLASTEFGCHMEILPPVNPNKEQEVKEACINALKSQKEAEWVISITSAPKTVAIFAVDVAREHGIPCWHLNTDDREVISFSKDIPIDVNKLFEANVDQYMKLYEREYEIPNDPYRKLKLAESWYEVAKLLAHMPEATQIFLKAFRQGVQTDQGFTFKVNSETKALVHELQKHDFLTIARETADALQCTIIDRDKQKFLTGDWLETYVWREIKEAKFAQDCQWGYRIFTGQASNELDVAFTYKGMLLIVECKTDNDPFTKKSHYLNTLDSISTSLGGSYTSKFFVASHPAPKTIQSYQSFSEQAKKRGIFIITGQDLRNIGAILKKEAETPSIKRT
jgi:hypothetical protein